MSLELTRSLDEAATAFANAEKPRGPFEGLIKILTDHGGDNDWLARHAFGGGMSRVSEATQLRLTLEGLRDDPEDVGANAVAEAKRILERWMLSYDPG